MPNQWEQPNAWAMPDIQQLLELRERALQQQQQQQQQEPPTPADMVTAETMQGVNANRDAYNQQQVQAQMQPQQQPYLTPQEAHLLGLIVNNKDAYEHADTYAAANNPNEKDKAVLEAAANDIRTMAHAGNDRIREQAKAIGLDLNGYENVGYQDAYNTLQDRKAKEIAELMGNTGRYSVSTDQFYNDNYLALIGEGKSAREAKRIAGRRAQEYQADRVTYLRNAFNVHGLDGNYVNGTGVDILNEMAEEMPTVANVYAQAYQLPTQLQDRFNKLQDEDIKQANALELADVNNGYALGKIDRTGQWNFRLQQDAEENAIARDKLRYEQENNKMMYEWGKKWELWVNQKDYEEKIADARWQKQLDRGIRLGQTLGYKGDELRAFVAASVGINFVRGKDGKSSPKDDKSVENLKKVHDMVSKQIEAYDKILESPDVSNEERRTTLARRQMAVDYLDDLQTAAGDVIFGGKDDGGVAALTGDLEKDAPTLDALWEDTGHDPEKFKNAVKYVLYQGGTETVSGGLYEQRIMEKYTRK